MAETVYLLLGSNLGDRKGFLEQARDRLSAVEGLETIAVSPIYITEPKEMPDYSPMFLNQVIKAEYAFRASELLVTIEQIERDLGRTDKGTKQPRTIDIDILLFGETVIQSERLCIPHKKLLKRPFAMVPLLEIDPDLIHPATKRSIADSLTPKSRKSVILYEDHVARNV